MISRIDALKLAIESIEYNIHNYEDETDCVKLQQQLSDTKKELEKILKETENESNNSNN
jgi:hypothetical protein